MPTPSADEQIILKTLIDYKLERTEFDDVLGVLESAPSLSKNLKAQLWEALAAGKKNYGLSDEKVMQGLNSGFGTRQAFDDFITDRYQLKHANSETIRKKVREELGLDALPKYSFPPEKGGRIDVRG